MKNKCWIVIASSLAQKPCGLGLRVDTHSNFRALVDIETDNTEVWERQRGEQWQVWSSPWRSYRLLPLLKDAVYPVSLSEQCGVAETHPQAQEDPSQWADSDIRRGDHQERDAVAQKDPRQQHVAHLPAGRSDDRRVIVPHKGDNDERGSDDSQHWDEDGHDGPGRVPLQLDDGDGNAAGAVGIGSHLVGTQLTGEFRCLQGDGFDYLCQTW